MRSTLAALGLVVAQACGGNGATTTTRPTATTTPTNGGTSTDLPAQGTVHTGAGNTAAETPNTTGFAKNDKLAILGLTALPLTGCVPSVWSGQITLGDQSFSLLVDSGSTTTAVAGSSCDNCSSLTPTYDEAGARATGGTASATYGDKSGWSGKVYRDLMGSEVDAELLTPQVPVNFAAMATTDDFFTTSICSGDKAPGNAYQGILGLGPDLLLERGTTSYLAAVAATGALKYDAFAVQLCDLGGRMWFGGYDPNYIAGEPQYTPIMPYSRTTSATAYYGINMTDLTVDGTSLNLAASAIGSTVVDTGTSSFLLKPSAFSALSAKIGSSAAYRANFPSSMITQGSCNLPTQDLTPEEIDAALPKVGMTFPNADGAGSFTITLPATQSYLIAIDQPNGGFAYCSVLGSSSLPIMGGSVMRGHVVVFDRDAQRVGFVPQAPCLSGLPQAQVR